ncbi:MAG: GNAT family N-acetyltransferase [Bacteroidaceae bacterium]|nr:GNAT family N-acetyltransferase [Bacteroidaceae bacterium]
MDNNKIINNLYEFWAYIGKTTELLIEAEDYKAVCASNSDWPKRVFALSDKPDLINEIINLSSIGKLPNMITLPQPNKLKSNPKLELTLVQRNMAMDLRTIENHFTKSENIFQVKSTADAIDFANTASTSFGYKVDGKIVFKISLDSSRVRLFNYIKGKKCLGCGIIYFDSYNNAGLHMIGTVPNGRGLGIGTRMTKRLLSEAIENKTNYGILQASSMGEPIYKKLGFIGYGELETYRIHN